MGAGDAAVGLVKELSRSHEWRVVGLLDDDEKKRGRLLHGVRVIGALEDLPRFAQRLKLRHAIIAMPSVPYKVRRRVVEICKRAKRLGDDGADAQQRVGGQGRARAHPQGRGRGPDEARAGDARRRAACTTCSPTRW